MKPATYIKCVRCAIALHNYILSQEQPAAFAMTATDPDDPYNVSNFVSIQGTGRHGQNREALYT